MYDPNNFANGFNQYLQGLGWDGQGSRFDFAQSLRQQGQHPWMDYFRSMRGQGMGQPGMGLGQLGQPNMHPNGNTGIVPPQMPGYEPPHVMGPMGQPMSPAMGQMPQPSPPTGLMDLARRRSPLVTR